MAKEDKNLFQRLTNLFRSGPVVKRKLRNLDTTVAVADKTKSSGTLLFQKSMAPTYATITANAYNLSERLMRYQDFGEMEYTPELAAALDIYADETCAQDDKGRVLHIYSDNEKIKEILEDLFYNTLNVEFNLRAWVRNLVKYGDMFLYNDVSPTHGVINAFPIPVNEIEREENYDPNDPMAVRYRWVTLGNRTLENWEVTHFRLLGNDMFLPYGSSVIEPARRIWRQLILIEDAMLVYRVVRAPERRVFYIDVANIPAENVPMYVEEQRKNLRSNQVIDRQTGRVDLRYNPLSVDEDYFIPVRGGESGTKIDTLAGGQNAAAVEDVAYIQKKLFAALKIPRAYLGYDESLSSKATLAQEDIRFSRTINVIQKTIISELNKLAIIHLYAHGFDSEDLQNFVLRLSNPSTVAQQQKLELWRAKFEIAGSAPEGQMSKEFIRKEIWGLNDEQCKQIDEQRLKEKIVDQTIENAKPAEDEGGGDEDLFGGGGEEEEGGEEETEESSGEEGGEDLFAGDNPIQKDPRLMIITAGDDRDDDEDFPIKTSLKDVEVPVKAQKQLDRALYNRARIDHGSPSRTHMPDFKKMTDSSRLDDPYDAEWTRNYLRNPLGESHNKTNIGGDVMSALRKMSLTSKFQNRGAEGFVSSPKVLSESQDDSEETDLIIDGD
jgi:Bacteriophage T4-like portal protein (Gp20)